MLFRPDFPTVRWRVVRGLKSHAKGSTTFPSNIHAPEGGQLIKPVSALER